MNLWIWIKNEHYMTGLKFYLFKLWPATTIHCSFSLFYLLLCACRKLCELLQLSYPFTKFHSVRYYILMENVILHPHSMVGNFPGSTNLVVFATLQLINTYIDLSYLYVWWLYSKRICLQHSKILVHWVELKISSV